MYVFSEQKLISFFLLLIVFLVCMYLAVANLNAVIKKFSLNWNEKYSKSNFQKFIFNFNFLNQNKSKLSKWKCVWEVIQKPYLIMEVAWSDDACSQTFRKMILKVPDYMFLGIFIDKENLMTLVKVKDSSNCWETK